jgi:DNA polymerase-4
MKDIVMSTPRTTRMDRSIIHLNIADFAVAVERLVDRRLTRRPLIIAPEGAPRATVYDMSEEAFQAGVRKGMALRQAIRLCPDAVILSPHPERYEKAMADLLRQALPYSPLVEPGERDGHLFLDVTGTSRLFGPSADVAWRLHRQTRQDLGLNPIWALAANKLISKVASRLVKPSGEYIVLPGDEAAFLAPLPVGLIPGIEGSDLNRLRELNLFRVHQITELGPAHLEVIFGQRAAFLTQTLQGIDVSPVLPADQRPPQVVMDHCFSTDTHSPQSLEAALYGLVEQAGRILRHCSRSTRRIAVTVDHSDGRRYMRQVAVQPASANDLALFPLARHALRLAWTRRIRIRRIGLVCDRLVYPPAQQLLFIDAPQGLPHQTKMVDVMDRIRDRFGPQAIKMGRVLSAS